MESNNKQIKLPSLQTKKETKNNYNKMSKWYDLFAGFERKYREIGLKLLNPEPSNNILEIGFGTGRSIAKLVETTAPNGQIFGIDLSDGMCKKTNSIVKKKRIADRIFITCADAIEMPFRDDVFDQIFISFTIELFDLIEIPLVLANCKRVLKNHGQICIVTLSRRKVNLMVKLYERAHNRFPKIIDCRPILIEKLLQGNNFQIKKIVEKKMWGLPVDIILAEK
ncbi:MAG TPA: class I SAM-dependent methyltransferase [candidate division Zixibacteria bacterium]|nr:class I SAM-dependent methyltransferase [candidate division Zixibacteria bacterium]